MANMSDFNLGGILDDGDVSENDCMNLLNSIIGDETITESTDPAPSKRDVSIPVPNKTEITAEVYNRAIANLEKSFKEGAEILGMLQNIAVVESPTLTLEEQQEAFTEAMIIEAALESYADGPYFEAAEDDNKDAIKTAVNAIKKAAKSDKYHLKAFTKNTDEAKKGSFSSYFDPKLIFGGSKPGLLEYGRFMKAFMNEFRQNETVKSKYWQMVGSFYPGENELKEAMDHYAETFKEQLGSFKFGKIAVTVKWTTKKGTTDGQCYLLTVGNSAENGKISFDIKDKKTADAPEKGDDSDGEKK